MELGINDLNFDAPENLDDQPSIEEQTFGADSDFVKPWIGDENTVESTASTDTDTNTQAVELDVIVEYLTQKGIRDVNNIKFELDDGTIISKPWKELSKEELLNILNTPIENPDYDLDDQEIELINKLRLSKMSPEEFILKTKLEGAQDYAENENKHRTYTIDSVSDDDLFLFDLQDRSPDLTDEELRTALSQAKTNPDVFNKLMAGIRAEYKRLEELNEAEEKAINEQNEREAQEAFASDILQAILNMNSIGSLDISLDNDDREELTEFILGKDQAGNSYLGKALDDPETLTRMAWFALKGADALDEIQEYFLQLISLVRQQAYLLGLLAGKEQSSHVVVQKPINGRNDRSRITDINQLD